LVPVLTGKPIASTNESAAHIYLSEHLAWSGGGVSLAKQNQGNEFGREMRQIAAAIEEARRVHTRDPRA
jgi:hypothetical protein